ncbi:hypothetical protein D9M69_683730 [compost metagenome]
MISIVEEATTGIRKSHRHFWQTCERCVHGRKLAGIGRIFRFIAARQMTDDEFYIDMVEQMLVIDQLVEFFG